MTNYEKPIVLANGDLAEGVYAASGAVVPGSEETSAPTEAGGGSASVSKVELTSSGNQYYKVNTYQVTITNGGTEELRNWTATVSVTSGTATAATTYDGWLVSVSMSGNTITIKPINSESAIGAGQSVTVSVVVNYSGNTVAVEGK